MNNCVVLCSIKINTYTLNCCNQQTSFLNTVKIIQLKSELKKADIDLQQDYL